MPLPGKVAGDPVHFDFAYFADGGVLALGEGGAGALAATNALRLSAYQRQRLERISQSHRLHNR
jgi:hypothetical protein